MSSEDETENKDSLITDTGVSFRDSVSNIDKKGKRVWINPSKPKGRFHRARAVFAFFALALFFIVPFVKLNGKPYFLINVIDREFIFFGKVWWPQDFYIFAIGFLLFLVFIVLFTAVYGRLFCGWACPQTVFMEMVFRKIEYLIEGDAPKKHALDKAPFTFGKFFRKALKHIIFYAISMVVMFFLISYFIGIEHARVVFLEKPGSYVGGNIFYYIISGVFYGVFAWFREQACIYVCPYGRLQSVMIDKNSIIVAYDYKRGEPRSRKKHDDSGQAAGDCIDCGACVRVCPTGIDIRNGLQLECVNCTACIDSCDAIMDKVNKPKGLIRYASMSQIDSGTKFRITGRVAFYTILLFLLVSVFSFMIISRTDIDANILRARGSTYNITDDGMIANIYTFKLINKTFDTLELEFRTDGDIKGKFELIGADNLKALPNQQIEGTFLLKIPKEQIRYPKNKIKIGIYHNGIEYDKISTNFSGPDKYGIN